MSSCEESSNIESADAAADDDVGGEGNGGDQGHDHNINF